MSGDTTTRRATDLYGPQFLAAFHTTAYILDDLVQGRPHRHLYQTTMTNLTRQGEYFRTLAILSTDLPIFISPMIDYIRNLAQSFYIIDQGRTLVQSLHGRIGRPLPRKTSLPFNGGDQSGFLSTDKSARSLKYRNLKRKVTSKDMISHPISLPTQLYRFPGTDNSLRIFRTDIEYSFLRTYGISGYNHTLYNP